MKPEHPSTALPSTARIHYGRAYDFDHSRPVAPLGLIHPASMETLLDQFEAKVSKYEPRDESLGKPDEHTDIEEPDPATEPADIQVVKEMRANIIKVLGKKLSPTEHQMPRT